MSRLLPTSSNASTTQTGSPSLVSLDDERTADVLEALSSEIARAIFRDLTEQPMTASTIAEQFDTSVQSVSYHLENLEDAGLIEVADTCYSEKGREMNVYTVAEDPLLVFLGTEETQPALRAAFKSLSAAIGPPAVLLAAWETLSRIVGFRGDEA